VESAAGFKCVAATRGVVTTFVVGTDAVETSATLCDYLVDRVETDDVVHAVNSLPGGDETDAEASRDGEDALNVVAARLDGLATVETRQFVRGNEPATDLLAHADAVDADELVIGVRERTPTAKVVFGSTAQRVLLRSNRPIAVVPLERV
jgi:nucleotide-binding universal stress UspA family protein